MSDFSSQPPPVWIRPAILSAAQKIHAEIGNEQNHEEAAQLLNRLIFSPDMRLVWDELYKKKRANYETTAEYFHPACVTHKSDAERKMLKSSELRKKGDAESLRSAVLLDKEVAILRNLADAPFEAGQTEQDLAVQYFLRDAFHLALDFKPILLADILKKIKTITQIAETLRTQANLLHSIGLRANFAKLNSIADDLDDDAHSLEPPHDDPGILKRARGDLRLRAFIANLSISTSSFFGTPLYSTLATVTNTVFERRDLTAAMVKEILRGPKST